MSRNEDEPTDRHPGLADVVISSGAMNKLRRRAEADPFFMRILNDVIQDAGSAPWRRVGDGVSIRPIWDDRTYLLRCAAGKEVSCHIHDREELLIVLDGEMRIGEAHLFTGDMEISPAGSEHAATKAIEDCLALVQYSD